MSVQQSNLEGEYTTESGAAVHLHLERLLSDAHFSHSKRFPSFLRFIVEEELSGRGGQLKERTIGIRVFGRRADYDTTADPIVRVTAAEIRKRIAQYYQGTGQEDELRLSLPAGSYVPHFDWLSSSAAAPGATTEPVVPEESVRPVLPAEANPIVPPLAAEPVPPGRLWWYVGFLALASLLAFAGYRSLRPKHGPLKPLEAFWAPVLAVEDHAVVICFPHGELQTVTLRDARQPALTHSFPEQTRALYLDDVQPLVSIVGLLGQAHREYLLLDDTTPLTDLRRGPTVFLGAYDNDWTLRITHDLRYHFANDPEMKHFWIEDSQHPQRRWQVDRGLQVSTNNYRDYALVARFVSPSTGQIAIVSAGIARGGTVAAGEFLTRANTMNAIKEHAPSGWAGQNMEFVLSTEIIDGRSGPPRIEAMAFW